MTMGRSSHLINMLSVWLSIYVFLCVSLLQVLNHVILDGTSIPTATTYGVFGVTWVFAIGFLLQGLILTALVTFIYYILLGLHGTSPRRINGLKSYWRNLKARKD